MEDSDANLKTPMRKPRFRFSIRVLLGLMLLASVSLAAFAIHLKRLDRQDAAVEFLAAHDCKAFIGEFADMHTVSIRTCTGGLSGETKYHFVEMIRPKSLAQPPDGLLAQIAGERFVDKRQVLWIGQQHDLQFETLSTQLKKLPWLKSIVLETVPANRGFILEGEMEQTKVEQCALTSTQINKLQVSMPDLEIRKSAFDAKK